MPKGCGRDATTATLNNRLNQSVEELSALNTALCFLVSINADAKEVHAFLMLYPHALLFDGTSSVMVEESARFIVEQQLQRCCCFAPTCQRNRLDILDLLRRGFDFYDWQRWCQPVGATVPSSFTPAFAMKAEYKQELVRLERTIQSYRRAELNVRYQLLETASEIRQLRHRLASERRLILCVFTHEKQLMEQKLCIAVLNIKCLERDHGELLHLIRTARENQFALLQQIFARCRRHFCSVLGSSKGKL